MKICLFVVEINPPLIWRFLDHLTCKIPFKIIRFRTTNIYLNTIDYWSVKYFEKIAPSAIRSVESAWVYCENIKNLKLKKLGSSHIRDVMENGTREVIRGSSEDEGSRFKDLR